MARKRRKFCSGKSAEELEMITLFGSPRDVDQYCWFTSEEEVYVFLENMGITRSSVQTKDSSVSKGKYVMKTIICPKPCGNSFLLQYHWYRTEGKLTTLILMDDEVFSPPFYNHYVSLRQLGNPNRILRLYALMRKAREQLALFQEKAHRCKKEGEKRKADLEKRFIYQFHRLESVSAKEMSLATLQGELEEVYGRREGMKIVSRQIVDVPVSVLARDESSGATIYGGDFGGLSSPRQKKEMEEMMKKKEEDREMGVGEDMGSVEEVEKKLQGGEDQPEPSWREEEKEKKEKKQSFKTVKALRGHVAAMDNPHPKKPMIPSQYSALRNYWFFGAVKIWRWPTQMSVEAVIEKMEEDKSRCAVTIHDQKQAAGVMTRWSSRNARQSLNGKALLATEVNAILDINERLREVFPCSVVEVSFLKKRTVFARTAALSAGADPQAMLLSEVTADTRGLGVVVSTEVLHFLTSTHILYVDACHCEDGWVIMVACFLDGAHHIQPVGFYLCPSERESYWKVFLQMIKIAGVTQEAAWDLVVISDQDKGLEEAVKAIFPWCEHTPCSVHRERHFQDEWKKAHGALSQDDEEPVRVLNRMVGFYRMATIATTKEECEKWLNEAKSLEFFFSLRKGCDLDMMTHVADYMRETTGVWMWEFKHNHLMETTSNPVESCMSWIQKDLFGMGNPRDEGLFNRYRLLLMWIISCDHNRRVTLEKNFAIVQTAAGVKELTDWALRKMIQNGHFVECNSEDFVVERGAPADRGLGVVNWDGLLTDEDVGNNTLFRVVDTKTRLVYTVDLENWRSPCSCHITHWQKVPCVHVMMVLRMIQSPDMVWCFFGEEYTVERVRNTCAKWTEQESAFFQWLSSSSFTGKEKNSRCITRETAKGNGTTTKRKPSTGDLLYTPKGE